MGRGRFSLFYRSPILGWLLGINIALYGFMVLFALLARVGGQEALFRWFYHKLVLPGNLFELLRQPWSIVTHMF